MNILKKVLVFSIICVVFSGCSTPPKPKSLVRLLGYMSDSDIPKVNAMPDASKFVSEARKYQRLAEQSYQSGELEDASEYALLGDLKIQTAFGLFNRNKVGSGIDSTNQKLIQVNDELQSLAKERNSLISDIQLLTKEIFVAKRKAALASLKNQAPVSYANHAQTVNSELQSEIDAMIAKAQEAEGKAALVEAERYAPQLYNLALNRLHSIITSLSTNQPDYSMVTELKQIVENFHNAYQEAEAPYRLAVAKADPVARRKSLRDAIALSLDSDSMIEDTPGGIRLIMAGLFPKRDSELDRLALDRVHKIAQVIKNYDDFSVQVEGFSSKTKNLTVSLSNSQIRAQQVAKLLEEAGLPRGTVEWRGVGATGYRFPPKDNRNDRVEIAVQRFD